MIHPYYALDVSYTHSFRRSEFWNASSAARSCAAIPARTSRAGSIAFNIACVQTHKDLLIDSTTIIDNVFRNRAVYSLRGSSEAQQTRVLWPRPALVQLAHEMTPRQLR